MKQQTQQHHQKTTKDKDRIKVPMDNNNNKHDDTKQEEVVVKEQRYYKAIIAQNEWRVQQQKKNVYNYHHTTTTTTTSTTPLSNSTGIHPMNDKKEIHHIPTNYIKRFRQRLEDGTDTNKNNPIVDQRQYEKVTTTTTTKKNSIMESVPKKNISVVAVTPSQSHQKQQQQELYNNNHNHSTTNDKIQQQQSARKQNKNKKKTNQVVHFDSSDQSATKTTNQQQVVVDQKRNDENDDNNGKLVQERDVQHHQSTDERDDVYIKNTNDDDHCDQIMKNRNESLNDENDNDIIGFTSCDEFIKESCRTGNTLYCQKKVIHYQFGIPDVLQIQYEDGIPSPDQPDHVIIKIQASTVSVQDCVIRSGYDLNLWSPRSVPIVPGMDVVGTILCTGSKAYGFNEHDRVIALLPNGGGNAKYISISTQYLIKIPPCTNLLRSSAAVIMASVYTTAYQVLKHINTFDKTYTTMMVPTQNITNNPNNNNDDDNDSFQPVDRYHCSSPSSSPCTPKSPTTTPTRRSSVFSLHDKKVLIVMGYGIDPIGYALIHMCCIANASAIYITSHTLTEYQYYQKKYQGKDHPYRYVVLPLPPNSDTNHWINLLEYKMDYVLDGIGYESIKTTYRALKRKTDDFSNYINNHHCQLICYNDTSVLMRNQQQSTTTSTGGLFGAPLRSHWAKMKYHTKKSTFLSKVQQERIQILNLHDNYTKDFISYKRNVKSLLYLLVHKKIELYYHDNNHTINYHHHSLTIPIKCIGLHDVPYVHALMESRLYKVDDDPKRMEPLSVEAIEDKECMYVCLPWMEKDDDVEEEESVPPENDITMKTRTPVTTTTNNTKVNSTNCVCLPWMEKDVEEKSLPHENNTTTKTRTPATTTMNNTQVNSSSTCGCMPKPATMNNNTTTTTKKKTTKDTHYDDTTMCTSRGGDMLLDHELFDLFFRNDLDDNDNDHHDNNKNNNNNIDRMLFSCFAPSCTSTTTMMDDSSKDVQRLVHPGGIYQKERKQQQQQQQHQQRNIPHDESTVKR